MTVTAQEPIPCRVTALDIVRARWGRRLQDLLYRSGWRREPPLISSLCPVAIAVKRKLKADLVLCSATRVSVSHGNGDWDEYGFPGFVSIYIDGFDRGLEVRPMAFPLSYRNSWRNVRHIRHGR